MRRDLEINGYVVAQLPNRPLLGALLALVVAALTNDGSTAHDLARAFFYVGLAVWAYLELAEGVNGWRRLLGFAGIVFVVLSMAAAFA